MWVSWKKALLVAFAAAVLSATLIGCGRDSVARINGRKVTKEEYYRRLERAPVPGLQPGQQTEAGTQVLQQIINEELIMGLAKEKGVEPTESQTKKRIAEVKKRRPDLDKQLKELELPEEQFRQMMEIEQAFFNLRTRDVKVTEEEIKKYYEQNKKLQFTEPEQVVVALIQTRNKADADRAIDMLKTGIQFSTVARSKSIDGPSKERGGVLPNPIRRGTPGMGPEIEKAVFSTQEGKYTKPLSAGNGTYAIFHVLKRYPQVTKKFEEVKYEIEQMLLIAKGSKKNNTEADLRKFRDSAKIDIGIKRYEKILKPSGPAKTDGD